VTSASSAPPSPPFEHPALFYRDQRDYLAVMMRFVSNGIAAGEPVMVAVPPRNLKLLQAAFGSYADEIEMHDMSVAGRNPGRIIGDVLLDFANKHSGRRVRIVGEPIWADRDATEYPACVHHEALINAAFAGRDATILCPYNTTELDPQIIEDAKRTHPTLWSDTRRWESEEYTDAHTSADLFNVPHDPEPVAATTMTIFPDNPNETRRFTASYALAAGLTVDHVADAVLVVDELVSNTIVHGGGFGRLAAWTDDKRVVFEVSDGGHIEDRLAGRRPPEADRADGRGLMIVHRLSDLVRMHTTPTGTTIRVYFDLF
jgi:anti-sigma regulatory factor (Ser/Thr protein kinase)